MGIQYCYFGSALLYLQFIMLCILHYLFAMFYVGAAGTNYITSRKMEDSAEISSNDDSDYCISERLSRKDMAGYVP